MVYAVNRSVVYMSKIAFFTQKVSNLIDFRRHAFVFSDGGVFVSVGYIAKL